jgi:hypothetical protein
MLTGMQVVHGEAPVLEVPDRERVGERVHVVAVRPGTP